jgi:hypothetical protein
MEPGLFSFEREKARIFAPMVPPGWYGAVRLLENIMQRSGGRETVKRIHPRIDHGGGVFDRRWKSERLARRIGARMADSPRDS